MRSFRWTNGNSRTADRPARDITVWGNRYIRERNARVPPGTIRRERRAENGAEREREASDTNASVSRLVGQDNEIHALLMHESTTFSIFT